MRIKRDELDILFARYIKARDKVCQRCGCYSNSLQTAHFHGRAKKSVRWDEDNAVALCFGCHMYLTAHPLEHTEWFRNHLGERFDMLNSRMRTPARYLDKQAIELYLREELKKYDGEGFS